MLGIIHFFENLKNLGTNEKKFSINWSVNFSEFCIIINFNYNINYELQ